MFKLLNRISWFVSILMGIIIFSFFNYGYYEMINIILGVLLGSIIKKLFFSEKFIQERLEVFAQGIQTIIQTEKTPIKPQVASTVPLQDNNEMKQEKIDLVDEGKKYSQSDEKTREKSQLNSTDYDENEFQDKKYNSAPSAIAIYLKKFFSENILAKIGSILVFLGVIFLMSLIWNQIPATLKVIIGFAIGFGTYFIGVQLDKKGLIGESRILLGTGVLINFLVILAAKYLLHFGLFNLDPVEMGFLATGITLLFLVLNTIFGVVTALVYKSRTLLGFSFIFAYLNPFFTGGNMDSPYTLVGYSMIVSLGALFIGTKQNDTVLKYCAFILGNILLLLAPFQTEIGWITILVSSAVLGLLTILNFTKSDTSHVSKIFIGNYIFIIFILILGGYNNIIDASASFIFYMVSILFFFGIGIWLFMKEILLGLTSIILFPLLIILGLVFTGTISFIAPALALVVLAYLIGFNSIQASLSPVLKYVFFGLLGGFIFMINSFFSITTISLDLPSFITVIVISFVFLFTSYYLSTKKNSEFLYTIGTIGTIFMFAPILVNKYIGFTADNLSIEGDKIGTHNLMVDISIIAVIIFALVNIILPFINKQLTKKGANIKNLLIGSVFGILFIGFQLFSYGSIYFPGVSLGLAFGILAINYFVLSYVMMNRLGIENIKTQISFKNIVFNYLFISISLFSLAIALVFANNPEIISTVWLFEATILFYFFNQTKENKVGILGLILFIIGIVQLFDLNVNRSQFFFLIPLSLIFISFVLNIKYLDNLKSGAIRVIHDIFHILGIGVISILLLEIIPNTGHGWSILGLSIFVCILGYVYAKFSSHILKIFFIVSFALFSFGHFDDLGRILRNIDRDNVSYLRILEYIAFVIIGAITYVWNKINTMSYYNKFINSIFIIYTLAIVSYFVFDIFDTTFAITIFWGIIASALLFYGISIEKIKIRTLGLYLLALVLGKIFIYDIWYGLDNAVTRVVAFMVIGILLIMISIKYTSKYGNNLKGEFRFQNLYQDKIIPTTSQSESEAHDNHLVNQHIEDIDVDDIELVKFYPNEGKNFSSKAKNLKKIVRMILEEKPCGTFAPNELLDVYNYIMENYKTNLSKKDFDVITSTLYDFVKKGGEVEIKKAD